MHALRIAHQGIELITTGRITLPVAEPARSELMAIRRGDVPLDDLLDELHLKTAELERALLASDMSDEPDHDAIDAFLVRAHEIAWKADSALSP